MEKSGSPLDPLYDFKVRSDYTPSPSSPYYIEFFWNLEKASKSEVNHFISLMTPITQTSYSPEDLDYIHNFYLSNKNASEINLVFIRNSKNHQIEGYMIYVACVEYYLPNNLTKENEYTVLNGFAITNPSLRNKGIFEVIMSLYAYPYCIKNNGKNCVFNELVVNPATYKYFTKNHILFPSYFRQIPRLVEDFMFMLIKKYNYKSLSPEKPFVIKDATINDFNSELWRRSYQKLSNEMKFFIDQTELKPGYGLLFFTFATLLQGNSLGLPCCQYYLSKKLPELLFKEFHFDSPKL